MGKRLWTIVLGVPAVAGLACGFMPRDIAKNCERAISLMDGRMSEMAINDCVRYYSTVATEDELVILDCMAGAGDHADWSACRVGPPEDAFVEVLFDDQGKEAKSKENIELVIGSPEMVETPEMAEAREIARNAGILKILSEGDASEDIFGSGAWGVEDLDSIMGPSRDGLEGIGGIFGAQGVPYGTGGLGTRGSGLGGGGTAEGLGGLGTTGYVSGASGYGSGGGNSGLKGASVGAAPGDPMVTGALDRELIVEVVKRHMNQIRYCYQRELTKDPALTGKLVIDFVISAEGTVSQSKVKSSTMGNEAVEQCVVGRFARMAFPKPEGGGIVSVSYSFVFKSG